MTIDVNIPESAVEVLTDKVLKCMDLDSTISDAIDHSELSSRVDDLERKVDDIDTSECVSDDDFRDLEQRVEELECSNTDSDKVEELERRLAAMQAQLDEFFNSLRVAADRFDSIKA
jgi:uncharacterized coiled-coil protein SlyX